MNTYSDHEIASIFPLMADAELKALADDIKEHGLREPIMIYEGKILDGRNRYRACKMAGVDPRVNYFHEGSPAAYVISVNLERRHLTPSQRACVAVDSLPFLEKEAKERQRALSATRSGPGQKQVREIIPSPEKGKASERAAEKFHLNPRYVSDAKAIQTKSEDLFQQVRKGEKTIPEAKKDLRKIEQARKQEEAVKAAPKIKPWTLTDAQDVVKCSALITDPPYGILAEEWEPKDLEKFTREWAGRWAKCDADLVCIFWSQRYLWDGRKWFDSALAGYSFQQLLVWHYPNNKSPQSRMGFKQTWEPVLLYRKNGCDRQIRIGGSEWGEGLNDFDCHVAAVPQSNFNDAETKVHPAQKPVSVFRWLINATTSPGELVCDPFAGSGASGIAAVQLKRRWHGIEISPEYRGHAEKRISTYGV